MLGERSRTQKDTPWVKVTLIWPMLSMTPSPPRSRVQISTQSRGLPTSHSLEIPTTVEISIQGQSQCHVPSLAALTTVEEVVAATPPVMTATEARTVEMAIPRTATHKTILLFWTPAGNRIAKIVSPIVCGLLVTLAGATASYFQYNRRKNCCRANVNFQSQGSRERYLGGVCSFWTLLPKENHRRTKLQTFLSKGGLHLQEGSYETEAYSGSIFLRIWATSKSQNLPLASLCWWMGGTEQPPGRGEPWCT
ncbi:glycoprotein Xg isoform X6 [Balaenoptera musculus]|uniref:Glycoprotein Xg isoform X6 n=1 Tax=Balaenoptera musculus TaxID=9771 RepID=A0A8B8WI55_BALMU|nr:glycoprotein Xg isoform X6 [Balaenoptera musculus]